MCGLKCPACEPFPWDPTAMAFAHEGASEINPVTWCSGLISGGHLIMLAIPGNVSLRRVCDGLITIHEAELLR